MRWSSASRFPRHALFPNVGLIARKPGKKSKCAFRRKLDATEVPTADFCMTGSGWLQGRNGDASFFVPSCSRHCGMSPFPGSEFPHARLHHERPGLIACFHSGLTQKHEGRAGAVAGPKAQFLQNRLASQILKIRSSLTPRINRLCKKSLIA